MLERNSSTFIVPFRPKRGANTVYIRTQLLHCLEIPPPLFCPAGQVAIGRSFQYRLPDCDVRPVVAVYIVTSAISVLHTCCGSSNTRLLTLLHYTSQICDLNSTVATVELSWLIARASTVAETTDLHESAIDLSGYVIYQGLLNWL